MLATAKAWARQHTPDWLQEVAFALGRIGNPRLATRTPLIMCARSSSAPVAQLPTPYSIRDIAGPIVPPGWVETMGQAGITVTAETWETNFGRHASACVIAILSGDEIVGTAGVTPLDTPDEGTAGLVTWVGVRPEHQGRGLGKPLIAACLEGAARAGMGMVFLVTDDHRLPAIRTYLATGFRPCLNSWDWTHRPRWRTIRRALATTASACDDPRHAAIVVKFP
jgi:GNAT superfamily N-acetyltransferase